MKIVHRKTDSPDIDLTLPVITLMENGKQWEKEDPSKAVKLYSGMIRLYPHKAILYDRLLMVYRKQQDFKKELQLLNTAISFFQDMHDKAHHRKASKKITQLSNAISKITGLSTGKKHPVSLPQPLAKWTKRKATVLNKIKSR